MTIVTEIEGVLVLAAIYRITKVVCAGVVVVTAVGFGTTLDIDANAFSQAWIAATAGCVVLGDREGCIARLRSAD